MDLTHRFRDCSCPGTPHSGGDTVTFRKTLPFAASAKALGLIFSGDTPLAQNAFPVYLHEGPETWNLIDEEGDRVELTTEAIDALSFADQYEIASHGDSLYSETILSPLVRRTKGPSETGPTTDGSPRRTRR